ncbi:hypothetical protein L0152_07395 [bacterium]|nr:hypothetical protein [bacterium]
METKEAYLRKEHSERKPRSKPSQTLVAMMAIERVMAPLNDKEVAMVRSWFLDNWPFDVSPTPEI